MITSPEKSTFSVFGNHENVLFSPLTTDTLQHFTLFPGLNFEKVWIWNNLKLFIGVWKVRKCIFLSESFFWIWLLINKVCNSSKLSNCDYQLWGKYIFGVWKPWKCTFVSFHYWHFAAFQFVTRIKLREGLEQFNVPTVDYQSWEMCIFDVWKPRTCTFLSFDY